MTKAAQELRLLRAEIERQDRQGGLHDRWCACWRCIGRLQAYIINTRLGRETWEDDDGEVRQHTSAAGQVP